jgi:hypothetical protein
MATGTVNTPSLNARSDPDTNSEVSAILVKDTAVDVILANEDDSWVLVSGLVDGHARIGWVQSEFITVDGTTNPPVQVPLTAGATNPAFPNVFFTALVGGGFFSSEPDNLHILRAIRTNNPGALNDSLWQHARPGYVGKTIADNKGNQTAIYSSPEYGVASWYTLLADHYKFKQSGTFTVEQLAHAYAGGGADPSAIAGYIKGWCKLADTQLSANSIIQLSNDDEMLNLAHAIFRNESFAKVMISNEQALFGIRRQRGDDLPDPPKPP